MRELIVKALGGAKLYIDDWDDEIVKSTDKLRVYDSHREYITYFETDYIIGQAEDKHVTPKEYAVHLALKIMEETDLETLIEDVLLISSYSLEEKERATRLLEDFLWFTKSNLADEEVASLKTNEEIIQWLENTGQLNYLGNDLLLVYEE